MKAISTPENSPLAARILKLVGVVLILVSLLDFVILSFPFNPLARDWQISFATQVVDRGIIPMVGLALLFAGYWIDNIPSDSPTDRLSWLGLRFWALLFSSLLGLLFLLMFPLHINNVIQARAEAIGRINKDVNQAQTQLQAQLGSEQAQAEIESQQGLFKSQIGDLLQNQQRLDQALASEQVPEQFKNILRQAKANPQAVDQLLKQQFSAEALRTQGLTQIQARQRAAEQQADREAWRSGLRVSISRLFKPCATVDCD